MEEEKEKGEGFILKNFVQSTFCGTGVAGAHSW
jgi:hypothetical protein